MHYPDKPNPCTQRGRDWTRKGGHGWKRIDIKRIRKANRTSQGVFAAYLNVSKATVTAWEQGLKQPSSMGLKLLNIVDRKGINALA
jgi:putative transcriptional regulator